MYQVKIIWQESPGKGTIILQNSGQIESIQLNEGAGHIDGTCFSPLDGLTTLLITVRSGNLSYGPHPTVVTIILSKNSFSFFMRDVTRSHPIYIPHYGVIVTASDDNRSYSEIVKAITGSGRQSRLAEISNQSESSYDAEAKMTRQLKSVTWLGLSRDIRNFEVSFHGMTANNEMWDSIKPMYHGKEVSLPELGGKTVRYDYFAGRGFGCILDRKRWLEKGVLPILNATERDEEIEYHYRIFVSTEKYPLISGSLKGTHYLVADQYSHGSMFTKEQELRKDDLHDREIYQDESTVCYMRICAINTGSAPRYSFVRIPQPNVHALPDREKANVQYDSVLGYGSFNDERVFLVAKINGQPVPNQEMSVLLQPGEKVEYVFMIPHLPISRSRAEAISTIDFDQKTAECLSYWQNKLSQGARISVPEKRIDEMIRAGVLHCDLVAYGKEPDGAVAATIGRYSPIGSESSPIIQFFDSMGWHDLARRSIMYFIEKQHDDGFMQNFGGYMLETGCVLWTIGEHFRYTRDTDWVHSISDAIVKAFDYIVAWRNKSKKEELRGHGYGMIDGKVADCEDHYHIYMLNSTAYVGMKRAAEVLTAIQDPRAAKIAQESKEYLADIKDSLEVGFAEAPVVPLNDGTWCPSLPVWTENPGPVCLQTKGGLWFTHGAMVSRDTLVSTQYLILDEVIEPDHVYADFILNCLADNFLCNNTAFSQPYYSPHPYANLLRGEVKPFLKEFYSNMSALADRETYSFWEHFFYASPHKTHEEAWFLMRCRWMLYLEAGDTLIITPGIPRCWLKDGQVISIEQAASYYGTLSFSITSETSVGKIICHVRLTGDNKPKCLAVRIPHPGNLKASSVTSGRYCSETETIYFDEFPDEIDFQVNF